MGQQRDVRPKRPSWQTRMVLSVLLADPSTERYGLELAQHTHLQGGTLYPILVRLEQSGVVTSRWEEIDQATEGRRRRRYYQLTQQGLDAAHDLLAEDGPWRVSRLSGRSAMR